MAKKKSATPAPTMPFVGERVVPFDENMANWAWVLRDHLMRYAWAVESVPKRSVVDLGCGTGYGTHLLSFVASSVTGIDINPASIEYADYHFPHDNLKFQVGDVLTTDIPSAEIYVAFEFLEHVQDPQIIVRRLPTGSTLLWSIPVSDPNQYHKFVANVDRIEQAMAGSAFVYQNARGNIDPSFRDQAKYVLGILNT